jgi:hypothetical protein
MSQDLKSDEEIDWAYKTIDSFKVALDRACAKPELINGVLNEMIVKFISLLESFTILANGEHRLQIYELAKTYAEVMKIWARQ